MTLTEHLRQVVRDSGLTALELSRICGIKPSHMAIFAGRGGTLPGEAMDRLATHFNLHLTDCPETKGSR